LFYHDGGAIVRVPVNAGATFATGPGGRLFGIKPFGGRLGPDFEVSSDGQRFLFLIPTDTEASRPGALVMVQNWVQGLAARLATVR
jgi:hypothetical protein